MPPKVDVNDPENARLLKLFESLNLAGNRAVETLTNSKHTAALESVISDNELTSKTIDPRLQRSSSRHQQQRKPPTRLTETMSCHASSMAASHHQNKSTQHTNSSPMSTANQTKLLSIRSVVLVSTAFGKLPAQQQHHQMMR